MEKEAKWKIWKRGMSKSNRKLEVQGLEGWMILNRGRLPSFSDTGRGPGLVQKWMNVWTEGQKPRELTARGPFAPKARGHGLGGGEGHQWHCPTQR